MKKLMISLLILLTCISCKKMSIQEEYDVSNTGIGACRYQLIEYGNHSSCENSMSMTECKEKYYISYMVKFYEDLECEQINCFIETENEDIYRCE